MSSFISLNVLGFIADGRILYLMKRWCEMKSIKKLRLSFIGIIILIETHIFNYDAGRLAVYFLSLPTFLLYGLVATGFQIINHFV